MFFIGIALVIAVGLALLVSADAGAFLGLTESQAGQALPLVIILILVAGGLFSRRRHLGELLGGVALWAGLFGAVMIGYTYRTELVGIAGRVFGELAPGVAIVDEERGTSTFRRGMGGHFELRTEVNGAKVPMIFDTGASAVVLTYEDAERAGLDPSSLPFTVAVSTANGMGRAAQSTLDRLVVGNIAREEVRAFIAERGALETSLLGMTFLETLSRYSVSADSLELED